MTHLFINMIKSIKTSKQRTTAILNRKNRDKDRDKKRNSPKVIMKISLNNRNIYQK